MTDVVNSVKCKFIGFFDVVGKLYVLGGVKVFYRGFVLCFLCVFFVNVGMFFTVDYIRRIID